MKIQLTAALALIACTLAPVNSDAADYQLGSCSVRENAPAEPCRDVRGKTATGIAPEAGMTLHDACTAAKGNARDNLIASRDFPGACGGHIDCGDPCRRIQK